MHNEGEIMLFNILVGIGFVGLMLAAAGFYYLLYLESMPKYKRRKRKIARRL